MTKSKLINALTEFYNGGTFCAFGGDKSEIRHDSQWNECKRVFNDGHGLIEFASVDDDKVLLINGVFIKPAERADIKRNLSVPFEFVNLGYPDYYNHGLKSIRELRKQQQS